MYNLEVLNEYRTLIQKLRKKEAFAFAHFNDGEMQYILEKNKVTISRGAQKYTAELAKHLKRVFLINNAKFYKGIPCESCFKEMKKESIELLRHTEDPLPPHHPTTHQKVNACIFHHNYVERRHELFMEMQKYKTQTWIISTEFNIEKVINTLGLMDTKIRQYRLPVNNAYETYLKFKKEYEEIKYEKNELVILLCGPVGRIIAGEGIVNNPETTFLCLGSYFDYLSSGINHIYFKNNRLCEECCPPCDSILRHWY